MPETMSTSFIARSVFDKVRESSPDALLRFASINPRNPVNRATPAEEALIRYFEQHPEAERWSGTMAFFEQGETYYVCAIPRRFEPSCLRCHGRPEDAPRALVERYGPVAGFGGSVGAVSLDLAAVPIGTAHAAAGARIWRHMLIALALCLLFLGGIAVLIRVDLMQRGRAEKSLRESEQRLASILQGSPIPTFIIDRSHRVIHWNRAMERLSGIPAGEILGTTEHWRAFYPSERPCLADLLVDEAVEHLARWYPEGCSKSDLVDEAYEAAAFFSDRQGHRLWLQFTAALIRDSQGRIVGATETLQDMTDRKRTEQKQMELLERLAAINRELRDFAYVVSHDLKAPLRAIKNLSDWLAADYQDQLDAQGKETLQLLGNRVDRMHDLIDGVLQYSRVGRAEGAPAPLALDRLLPELVADLDVPAHISIHIETDLPTVAADATRIRQVFQNLLSNAIKYLDKPQGRIAIACGADGAFWRFSVSDNGPGIERKHFERIFQLFQTLAPRDDRESTGVGLTIAKKIVEMYGGRIWVESEVGQGSIFFFTLPQARAQAAPETLQTCAAG